MRFVALGSPLELWENERQVELGSAKSRAVLSVLLYARGERVASHKLIDRVWGDEPPAKPQESLNPLVSRLRAVLANAVGDRARIERPGSGLIQLLLEDETCVDLWHLARLRKEAAAATARGDLEVAVGTLNTAESLWRGEPFAELPSEWAATVRTRLEEDRRRVREERIRLELELGRHADLIGELQEMASEHPFAQRPIGALMTALDVCGRTDEALNVYRDLHRRLRDEQGIDPSAELQALHHRLLLGPGAPPRGASPRGASPRGSAGTTPPLPQEPPQGATTPPPVPPPTTAPASAPSPAPPHPEPHTAAAGPGTPPPNSLPRDIRDFTGRDGELALLTAPPRAHESALPLTVVHGMAGVGKTALAVHAAHRLAPDYPAGVFYVDLRGYSEQQHPCDPAEALGTLLRAADATDAAREDAQSATLEARSGRWREWTARRKALLVLDNAKDAAQVRPLLPGASTCRAVVTSRSGLTALEGADFLHLDVLPLGEAAAFFTRVVGDARAPDIARVRRVVGAYAGHPLSLQILASGFRNRASWDLDHLAERVERADDPLDELEGDIVESAFRLSYAALDVTTRRLFRRLALHPGPDLSLGAARALAGPEGADALARTLTTLLDHHLLQEPVRERFALHDLAAAFARRVCRAEETPEARRAALERLLDHHLTAADRADRLAHPHRRRLALPGVHESPCAPVFADPDQAAVWLAVERPNLLALARAATTESPPHAALFPHVLAPSLKLWGAWDAAVELHTAGEAVLRAHGRRGLLAQTLVEHAGMVAQQSHGDALRCAMEAGELFAAEGDDRGRAAALFETGRARLAAGALGEALTVLDDALRLYRALRDRAGAAETLNVIAVALHYRGEYAEALRRLAEVLTFYDELADEYGVATALNNMGEINFLARRFTEAQRLYERAWDKMRLVGGPRDLAIVDTNLGAVLHARGETDQALGCYQRALASYRSVGDPSGEADSLISMGAAFVASGRKIEALLHYRLAEETARDVGNAFERQRALTGIGDVHRLCGRVRPALETYTHALDVACSVEFALGRARALDGMARTYLLAREVTRARCHGADALALYRKLDVPEEAESLSAALTKPAAGDTDGDIGVPGLRA